MGLGSFSPLVESVRAVKRAGRLVSLCARYPLPRGKTRYGLAVCTIFRDEARYLAEWVTFHRLQGVEHFWLYDNLSDDDWQSALRPELEAGIVTVTRWPDQPGQMSMFRDCLKRHRRDARWIAFIDVDEFLFSPTARRLPDVLDEFEEPGVVVNWRMYGTNGHQEPPAGLVVENYPMRGADGHPNNSFVKVIAHPRRTVGPRYRGPHVFNFRGVAVGEDHEEVRGHLREPSTADLLRINHYYSRSVSEYARKRTLANVGDGLVRETAAVPADDLKDEAITQFVPALRAALAARPQV